MPVTETTAARDVGVVEAVFAAFGRGDVAAIGDLFAPDATWNHRADDRLGGIHRGSDGIGAFLAESAQLTAGTLRPVPVTAMGDGAGTVAVVVEITGTRPDGRSYADRQVLLCHVEGERVRSVDQYIGDHAAVAAFWA